MNPRGKDALKAMSGCVGALLLYVGSNCAMAQEVGKPPPAEEKIVKVTCKLPPQVRKLSSGETTQMPGQVQQLTKAECKKRGGEPAKQKASK